MKRHGKIKYQDPTPCVSLGRNGTFKTIGIDVSTDDFNRLIIRGITSKDADARGNIEMPIGDVEQLVELLQECVEGYCESFPKYVRQNFVSNRWAWDKKHHYFSLSDWQYEVADGYCVSGYHEWVLNNLEQVRDELKQAEIKFENLDKPSFELSFNLSEAINTLREKLDKDFSEL